MSILVTGGLGYIGSHTVVELIDSGFQDVIIVDNLSNSNIDVLDSIQAITGVRPRFFEIDLKDEKSLGTVFRYCEIEAVFHFAGYKSVIESVMDPLLYYENNLISTISLLKQLTDQTKTFVFSSSATVYGEQKSPLSEKMDLKMTKNPYGETKAMAERILKDYSKTNQNLSIYIFRYFNPIGAHKSGLIGENPNGIPNNIMPVILKVAKGEIPELKIFGNDYNTLDGTGVRDYIHVKDLAAGHISALKKRKPGFNVYNLGTGKGSSVLELVNCFETENHVDVKYVFTKRREGDIDVAFADASKAARELDWTAKLTLKEMVKDAWRYKNIYGGKNEN